MDRQRESLMGKPHIGCRNGRVEEGALCAVCGRMATNAHHIVPKGMGGGNRYITVDGMRMESPLIAVCGFGNASGCHGKFHAGKLRIRWEWYGDVPDAEFEPHSPSLWLWGHYVLTLPDGTERGIDG